MLLFFYVHNIPCTTMMAWKCSTIFSFPILFDSTISGQMVNSLLSLTDPVGVWSSAESRALGSDRPQIARSYTAEN